VGYRVKSKRGVQFRIWATEVLKEYLLKGYALNQRMNRIENKVEDNADHLNEISFQIRRQAIPNIEILFDGQVYDTYVLTSNIIRSAKASIVLVDNYIDDKVITQLAKKDAGVQVLLLTKHISKQLELDVQRANEQYGGFSARIFSQSHDRFL